MIYDYLLADLARSLLRLFAAYTLSILTALIIGIPMGRSKLAETLLYPLIDVLQSIPVLGFFPAVLLIITNTVKPPLGAELASIILIYTGQVWNLILGVYSAVKAVPEDLLTMANVYRLSLATRVFKIYIPAAMLSIASNSIISWAGGLFFITACEVISLGSEGYRLRGIGADIVYLTSRGDFLGAYIGLLLLIATSLILYVFLWNPLVNLASAMTGGSTVSYPAVNILGALLSRISGRMPSLGDYIVYASSRISGMISGHAGIAGSLGVLKRRVAAIVPPALLVLLAISLFFTYPALPGAARALKVYSAELPWLEAAMGLLHSLLRVSVIILASFIVIAIAGFYAFEHGRSAKYTLILLGETLSSMPAFLWWSIFSVALEKGWINPILVSYIIIFQGAAWYIFFNMPLAPPTEAERRLHEMSRIYGVSTFKRFSKIYLPSMMPRIAAGLSASWGGAWNSVIAAEYAEVGSKTIKFFGLGYLLNVAASTGDVSATLFYALLLALFIVAVNRIFWRWLFNRAYMKYRVID